MSIPNRAWKGGRTYDMADARDDRGIGPTTGRTSGGRDNPSRRARSAVDHRARFVIQQARVEAKRDARKLQLQPRAQEE